MPLKYSIYKLRWSRRQVVGVNGGRTASRTLTPESRIQIDNLWPNTQFLFIVFLLFIISSQFHRRLCCYNSKHVSTKVKMSPPLDKKVNIRLNLAWRQSVLNRLCVLLFASDQTVFMCPDIANLWVAVETMLCASNNLCWWSSFPTWNCDKWTSIISPSEQSHCEVAERRISFSICPRTVCCCCPLYQCASSSMYCTQPCRYF